MDYPYQQQQAYGNGGYPKPPVEDNKTMAIVALVLSIVCCCNIPALGCSIYAVMQANDVQKYQAQGEQFYFQAVSASKNAKLFSYIAFALEIFSFIGSSIYGCLGGFSALSDAMNNAMSSY